MRDGLCHDIAMKPFIGGRRVAIIDDADYLNSEGANSRLKTLEEPPPRSVLILIGTSAARQLPTFFFQAEDGIRAKLVTGVQTCALPISPAIPRPTRSSGRWRGSSSRPVAACRSAPARWWPAPTPTR